MTIERTALGIYRDTDTGASLIAAADQQVRIDCLRIAADLTATPDQVVKRAQAYAAFVLGVLPASYDSDVPF